MSQARCVFNLSLPSIQISSFSLKSFCPRTPSGTPQYIQSFCLLQLLFAVTGFHAFLVFGDLDSLSDILQTVPQFSDQTGLMCFWEEDHRGKAPLLSHDNKFTCYQYKLARLMLTLITWLEVAFVRYLHCKVALFLFLFPYGTLWKKVTMLSPHLRGGSYAPPP